VAAHQSLPVEQSAFRYDSDGMNVDDSAAEYLRLAEHYRQMSDEELLLLVPQSSELTPLAQQALASEVRHRGLKPADEKAGASGKSAIRSVFSRDVAPDSRGLAKPDFAKRYAFGAESANVDASETQSSEEVDAYEEDRELVPLGKVWSMRDALKVQALLDQAGIPFFMGREKATGVDKVTSNFAEGVELLIMRVGLPWARQALQNYWPEDDPPEATPEEVREIPVHCPKCDSTEVVLEDVVQDGQTPLPRGGETSPPRYEWTCDACGHRWEDDGVLKEG